MKILAIGAHPDDVDIGCAGLLQRGDDRRIVVLSAGAKAGNPYDRSNEAWASAAILRAEISIHDLPDTALSLQSVVSVLETELREYKPDVVLTEPGNDTHQDHRAVHEATIIAARDLNGTLLAYFSPSAAERWQPNWFVPLNEDAMVTKVRATACHRSQQGRPYMAPDYIRSAGRYWAQVTRSAAPYVEAYQLLRYRGTP